MVRIWRYADLVTAEKTDEGSSDSREPRGRGREITKIKKSTPTTDTRDAAVKETAGTLTGAYDPGYLGGLREDWPA